jgi:hypothetical protein
MTFAFKARKAWLEATGKVIASCRFLAVEFGK